MELSKSALRVMNQLWEKGELPAKTLCGLLLEQCGCNNNTTNTILNSCVKKGLIERREPGFLCRPLVGREEVRTQELGHLVDGLFQGSPALLFSTLVGSGSLSQEDVEEMQALIDKLTLEMKNAAKLLEFEHAAYLRDKIKKLKEQ